MTTKAMSTPVFAERLKVARIKAGLNQSDLAQQLGVGQNAISNYERGSTPKLETAVRIAEILHVSLDWLLGLEVSPSQNNDKAFIYGLLERIATGEITVSNNHDGMSIVFNFPQNSRTEQLSAAIVEYSDLVRVIMQAEISDELKKFTLEEAGKRAAREYRRLFESSEQSA